MSTDTSGAPVLAAKDFKTDNEVRWCPGCGDYAILATVQSFMPTLGIPRERIVFVSGIGCSSRFPYYMNTYGVHSIHGRAPTLATGLSITRPDLSVWVVTGDGDGLSIGGNHLIHALRRNLNLTILLFNNRIYGLTKGQYSPTSELGKVTKSTPLGTLDRPLDPIALALGANATFVARALDSDRAGLSEVLQAAAQHSGAALVEIYQNCNIFNDGAFDTLKDAATAGESIIPLRQGEPIIFGPHDSRAVVRAPDGGLRVAETATTDPADIVVHDAHRADPTQAFALAHLADPHTLHHTPIGVFRSISAPCYDELARGQVSQAVAQAGFPETGAGDDAFAALLAGRDTWVVD